MLPTSFSGGKASKNEYQSSQTYGKNFNSHGINQPLSECTCKFDSLNSKNCLRIQTDSMYL